MGKGQIPARRRKHGQIQLRLVPKLIGIPIHCLSPQPQLELVREFLSYRPQRIRKGAHEALANCQTLMHDLGANSTTVSLRMPVRPQKPGP